MASTISSLKNRLNKLSTINVSLSEDEGDLDGEPNTETVEMTETTSTSTARMLDTIQAQGNRPEDWLEYIKMVRENTTFPSDVEKHKVLTTLYHKASRAIPTEFGKKNVAYAQLLCDHAEHLSTFSPEEASTIFFQARLVAKRFAFVHVMAAQFEVNQGNTSKASKILDKAKEIGAEPSDVIKKAFRNLLYGNKVLLTPEDKSSAVNHNIESQNSPVDNKENTAAASKQEAGLLQPRRSWIEGRVPEKRQQRPLPVPFKNQFETPEGNSSKAAHFYTDQIGPVKEFHSSTSDSDNSNNHSGLWNKPPVSHLQKKGEKDSTVSITAEMPSGIHTGMSDDDTVPCNKYDSGSGAFQRSSAPLRSYNSTPDCKNPSFLSGKSVSKDSARKARMLVPSCKPMRVKRCSLPQLNEGAEESGKDEITPLDDYEDPSTKESTNDIQAMFHDKNESVKQNLNEKMEVDESEPLPIAAIQNEDAIRKASLGSDSGIMTQPLDSAPEINSSSQSSASSTMVPSNPSTQITTAADIASTASQPAAVAPTPSPVCSSAAATIAPPLPAVPHAAPPPVMGPPAAAPYPMMMQAYAQQQGMMVPPPATNVVVVNGKSYAIIRMLGRGGSSKVYECHTPDTQMSVAIKCVTLEGVDSTTINSYKNEIRLLKRLQYSHRVIKLVDFEHNQDTNMLYVVMEKGDTDLATFFRQRHKTGGMSPHLLYFYWVEMLEAVQVLHKEGIVHSDLKPANFLLVAGNLKLIDFGIANAIQQDMTSVTLDQQVGTLNYMSPETIKDTCGGSNRGKPTIKIGVKSDVWSLGCILYNLVYGKTPFQHITNQFMKLNAIMDDNVPIMYPEMEHHNPDLLDTLQKCLVRDPKQRYSIDQLLKHPYCARR